MVEYSYRIFLIATEDRGTFISRQEGIVDFANPVVIGQNLEVTLGAKMPYEVKGQVTRVDQRGVARDVEGFRKPSDSSLFIQSELSQDTLNSYHDRNGPHE